MTTKEREAHGPAAAADPATDRRTEAVPGVRAEDTDGVSEGHGGRGGELVRGLPAIGPERDQRVVPGSSGGTGPGDAAPDVGGDTAGAGATGDVMGTGATREQIEAAAGREWESYDPRFAWADLSISERFHLSTGHAHYATYLVPPDHLIIRRDDDHLSNETRAALGLAHDALELIAADANAGDEAASEWLNELFRRHPNHDAHLDRLAALLEGPR